MSSIDLKAQTDTLVISTVNNLVLQQSDIRSITIAKDGKLWLCTEKGILSYDGNEVHSFSAIPNGAYRSFSDEKDNLYITAPLGIFYLDTKTGEMEYLDISVNSEDSSGYVYASYTEIFADGDGSMWCGRINMGLLHYNRSTKKAESYSLYSATNKNLNTVRSIQKDLKNEGILWLGTNDGIYSFNKKTHELIKNFNCSFSSDSAATDTEILKIQGNNIDTIWFTASRRGVGCYDIKQGRYTIFPYKGLFSKKPWEMDVAFFQPKSKHEYYIGSYNDCPGIFNTQTLQYTFNTKTYKDFPGLTINHVTGDRLGNLWCVIFGQLYAANVNKTKFTTILLPDRDNKSQVTNIFKTVIWDTKRKYYYVSFDNSDAIFLLDSNMRHIKSIPIETADNGTARFKEPDTYDIALDKNGNLWACGASLSVFDRLKQKMVPAQSMYTNLLFNDQRFQNLVCRGDYLYMQPSNPAYRAIYRVNLASFTFDSIPIPYEIIPPGVENLLNGRQQDVVVIDKRGRYAYVNLYEYLLQIDLLTKKGRKVARVTHQEFPNFFNMFWYVLDDDDRLWVSSGSGLRVYEPNTLRMEKRIIHELDTKRLQMCNAEGMGLVCLLYSKGVKLYDYRNGKQYHLSLSDGLMTLNNSSIACVNNMIFVGAQLNALQYLPLNSVIKTDAERKCYLSGIQLFNKHYITDTMPEYLHSLILPHDKNFVTLTFSSTEFEKPEQLEYRYRLEGVDEDWVITNYLNRTISYPNLKPGTYVFYTSIKNTDGNWNESRVNLHIYIIPAWWQTGWFKITSIFIAVCLVLCLIRWRIKTVRRQEKQKSKIEKEILELEAKALRAQMNPHFIFNCLNSIKSLIQQNENEKSVTYLTTFSKLIRTLFNNADKKEISLYDEMETCKLYLQLEAMRFDSKFSYTVNADESVDLKSVQVPAMIIQPFIENAIWHGIVPGNKGGDVSLDVVKNNGKVEIIIEDDGIGREASKQNKSVSGLAHQSKGVTLTQSRLELDNFLQQRQMKLETIDKKDEYGKAAGTKVILVINQVQ